MEQGDKLDLLLKKMDESEHKREAMEQWSRADFQALKKALETRVPLVQKKVDELGASVEDLTKKVADIQDSLDANLLQHSPNPHQPSGTNQSTYDSPPFVSPSSGAVSTSCFHHGQLFASPMNSSVPPMSCPQFDGEFDGDNPHMWRSNCESFFDVYGVHPANWVKVATLQFVGLAAFWLQSVRSQLSSVTWEELCARVCCKFTKDRHQNLIRQWIHLIQTGTVSEYVEIYDSVMHQLLAYDEAAPPSYSVTRFIEGLKQDIRVVVMVQKPQDLDTACSLALLQEKAVEGTKPTSFRRAESALVPRAVKSGFHSQNFRGSTSSMDDKKTVDPVRTQSRDDKITALKAYRRAKGLCFTCGERWGRDHKCASTVQLHVVEELMQIVQEETESPKNVILEEQTDCLMHLSLNACNGTVSAQSFRVKGWLQGIELLMLVDSGSTHSFLDKQLADQLKGLTLLPAAVMVKVADGGEMNCTHYLPQCEWWLQGHQFQNDFKVLPLSGYDAILGMDWLHQMGQMTVNWEEQWMQFLWHEGVINIRGIQARTDKCDQISYLQLKGLNKMGALMHMVQLSAVSVQESTPVSESISVVLSEFQSVFEEPKELPPRRLCDHQIPLLPGSKPVSIRPYRYNPA
ncbi:uncharacterized protein LOC121054888 [Oryza brachyantha]|uniref:uncharacterized protein LOC121054888 n=1 Tax=Oryza brachyantha TaxID=4533 RepID=UPI001ADA3DE0|nr:uncharacterized protein LOC121054888 [Oryza brachyantha]XP_040381703.1 uncharacterized protein LOC121054888 [Oryza brachyantha]